VNGALEAEFDTVATWTAQVALEFGPRFHLPAACRGSGSPAALRWLVDNLEITRTDRMLDCGAGVGGPAAFAAEQVGVRPILTDVQAGACRAARELFGFEVLQAGSELPLRSGAFDVAWSLGVLCTVPDHGRLLAELRRVLTDDGRLGLLIYTAAGPLSRQPQGNNFPVLDALPRLLDAAGLRIDAQAMTGDLGAAPADWTASSDAVDAELKRRHSEEPTWRTAAEQSELFGEMLAGGELVGTLIVAGAV